MSKDYHGIRSLSYEYSRATGKSIREAEEQVRGVLDTMINLLLDDTKEGIQIIDVLTLHKTTLASRKGYNFQAKKAVEIPEKKTIKLKVGKSLIQKLNK